MLRGAITTTEAARIAGVGPSTVKRWADQGRVVFTRTAGGHRRIDRATFERFLREQSGEADERDPLIDGWIDALVRGERHELDGRLLDARAQLETWSRVADELCMVLSEIGKRWASGRLSIAEEHLASEALARSLARMGDALPSRPAGPVCALATAQGDEHTLGLSLAELCLRERGWNTRWLGRKTPLSEVQTLVAQGEVDVVALVASGASIETGTLAQIACELGAFCSRHGVRLVLGGSGAWPDAPADATRLNTFSALSQTLARIEPVVRRR